MRRISVLITTMLMVLVLSLSSLFGCGLITVNNERDMNQIVATVQIEQDAPKEVIYKKDLAVAYLNYYYQSQSGTSSVSSFGEIIENLINDKVIVQYAMKYFAEGDFANSVNSSNKWNIETYLNDEEKLEAKYYSYKDLNDIIDSYVIKVEEEKLQDTFSGTARIVPTGATNDTELTDAEKQAYIDKGIDTTERRNAFVELINTLKKNDLLGDGYNNGDILSSEYYAQVLEDYQQSILITKFYRDVETKARSKFTYQDVVDEYKRIYDLQKQYGKTEFETALSGISATAPILYGRSGYGMVYHILLKADDATTTKLSEIKLNYETDNKTPAYENAKYRADRAELFKSITATDLRSSWVTSGYDFGEQTTSTIAGYEGYNKVFTGDYTLYKDQSLPFLGKVTLLNKSEQNDDDFVAQYRVDETEELTIDELVGIIKGYLYDGSDFNKVGDKYTTGVETYTAGSSVSVKADYEKRIKELMFAFSQDDGDTALNTFKGYAIKPTPDATGEEEWMEEFAIEGRNLIKQNQKTFKVVATDYGFHIMFYSEKYTGFDYPTLVEYLNYEYGAKDWEQEFANMLENWYELEDTNNYLYVLINNLSSTYVSQQYGAIQQRILSEYVYNNDVVVRYKETYKDLI